MQKKLYIILFCSLVSIGFHLYLSVRSYSIQAGEASKSTICYINDTVNCDNVLTSPYSRFMNIPLSNWGFATHFIIIFLALSLIIGWTDKRNNTWLAICAFSILSAEASLIMLGISSFVLHLFCPLCVILYVFSFISFICVITSLKELFVLENIKKVSRFIFPKILIIGIIIGGLLHLIFLNTYDLKSIKKTVKLNILDWTSSPQKNTAIKPLLAMGPSPQEAVVTLTEFADFLCGHCRQSYFMFKTFKKKHPQVRIEYFSFPLDHCKTARATCSLTRATYCAEKQKQGWRMHGLIFEHADKFKSSINDTQTLKKIKKLSNKLNINWEQWDKCVNSKTALQIPKTQLQAGKDIGIRGTPSLFINKKNIQNRYVIQTIEGIIKYLKK